MGRKEKAQDPGGTLGEALRSPDHRRKERTFGSKVLGTPRKAERRRPELAIWVFLPPPWRVAAGESLASGWGSSHGLLARTDSWRIPGKQLVGLWRVTF